MASQRNCIKYLKKSYPSLTIPKIEEERNVAKLILQVQYQPESKPNKDTTKKENDKPLSLMNIECKKSSTKYQQNKFNNTLKGLYTMTEIQSQDTRMVQYMQINQCDTTY